MQRWLVIRPRESLQLVVLGCAALNLQAIRESASVIMVINRCAVAVSLFKKRPFSKAEVEALHRHAVATDCAVYYWPKIEKPEQQGSFEAEYYASSSESAREAAQRFNECIGAYQHGKEHEFFASYQYNVT